jgi:hypothetical protein
LEQIDNCVCSQIRSLPIEIVGEFRQDVQFRFINRRPIRRKANMQLVALAVERQHGDVSRRMFAFKILEVHDFQ